VTKLAHQTQDPRRVLCHAPKLEKLVDPAPPRSNRSNSDYFWPLFLDPLLPYP